MSKIILNMNKLSEGVKSLGLNLSYVQIQQVEAYLAALQKWNRVFNLTAITNPDEMLTHHIFDSLAVGRFLSAQHYLDVGTGAGLPGMILAILFPEKHFTLLDSNSKKTSFIKQTAHQLGLKNVSVITSRIEIYQPDVLFDGVISRAFSELSAFIDHCAHFVKDGGALFAMKGPKALEEVKSLAQSYELEKIKVPYLAEERYLVVVTKPHPML